MSAGSYVVTGGGRGLGRAIVERLLADGAAAVVAIELDPAAVAWIEHHPAGDRVLAVLGDAGDEAVAARAADAAEARAPLAGWVNNAAVFREGSIRTASARELRELIALNIDGAVVGCATAVARFVAAGTPGAIVNVSSTQARTAIPMNFPYVTAKAAIEGMTRAAAVECGSLGIRVNAVAPGTIATEANVAALAALDPDTAARIERESGELHALGRVAQPAEVAATVVHLLSPEASFVTGATFVVDGGRSVYDRDPEV